MRKLTDFEIRQVRELVGGNDFILISIPSDLDNWNEEQLSEVPVSMVSTLDTETIEYTIMGLATQILKKEEAKAQREGREIRIMREKLEVVEALSEEEALKQCGHLGDGK